MRRSAVVMGSFWQQPAARRHIPASSNATQPLDVELPAGALGRPGDAAEPAIAQLFIEARRLERVGVEVDQAAAAPARLALRFLDQLASQPAAAGARREPEQLDVALAPVRLEDQAAQQALPAVAHGQHRALVAKRSRLLAVEVHQPSPQL